MLFSFTAYSQMDTAKWLPPAPAHYSFIKYSENVIAQHSRLDSVFKKLVALHATRKGVVRVIHIGDSHLQADGITSVLRNGFHDFFGDAGRGLVFPYQLANTNGPKDIHSSSNSSWKANRITNSESPIKTGIMGYGMVCGKETPSVCIYLKDENGVPGHFNRMQFFVGKESADYLLTDSSAVKQVLLSAKDGANSPSLLYESDSLLSGLELTRKTSGDYFFYGVSLERKDTSGVIYHTIGANGARYDQYGGSELFWEQLKALHGDIFILSMGTNEAQNQELTEQSVVAICDTMIMKIHEIAPGAVVLITTPPGSYYKQKRPNAVLQKVTNGLIHSAEKNSAAYWDLYHISGGKKSAGLWKKSGLLGHDLVHYDPKGYHLQGQMLLSAFAKAYNTYAKLHPYRPEPIAPKKTILKTTKPKTEKKPAVTPTTPNSTKKDTIEQRREHKSKIKVKYEK